jgi:hypothetical protein
VGSSFAALPPRADARRNILGLRVQPSLGSRSTLPVGDLAPCVAALMIVFGAVVGLSSGPIFALAVHAHGLCGSQMGAVCAPEPQPDQRDITAARVHERLQVRIRLVAARLAPQVMSRIQWG